MTESTFLPVAGFVVGYSAVLITPGPNLLSIGAIAALRGLRATLPLCIGIALGASMLAAGICTAISLGPYSPAIEQVSRTVAVVLLLYIATRILLRSPTCATGKALKLSGRDAFATFLAGASTALTNPITAAFFASQFLGALPDRAARATALGLVPCLALSFAVTLGFALSRPFAQRAVVVWHRPIRFVVAVILAATATTVAVPLFQGAPDIGSASATSAVEAIDHAPTTRLDKKRSAL